MRFRKTIFASFIAISIAFTCHGQQIVNYVNNPSFELALPSISITPWDAAKYWSSLDSNNCFTSYLRSADLGTIPYNSTGFQYPRTGHNYILTQFYCEPSQCGGSGRAYPKNRLKSTLNPNQIYCVKYHVVNTNNCVVGIDSYGAVFGDTSFDTITYCFIPLTYLSPPINWQNVIIMDTLEWVPITGTFVATGIEKYLLLGNFTSDASTQTLIINPTFLPNLTTDLYIDDVSVIEMELPAYAGPDTYLVAGDSVYIGRDSDVEIDESCIWYQMTSPTSSITIDTIAGLYVKPVVTSTYVVRQQLWCSGVKWDTVVVHMDYVGMKELQVPAYLLEVWPNPEYEVLNLQLGLVRMNYIWRTFQMVFIFYKQCHTINLTA